MGYWETDTWVGEGRQGAKELPAQVKGRGESGGPRAKQGSGGGTGGGSGGVSCSEKDRAGMTVHPVQTSPNLFIVGVCRAKFHIPAPFLAPLHPPTCHYTPHTHPLGFHRRGLRRGRSVLGRVPGPLHRDPLCLRCGEAGWGGVTEGGHSGGEGGSHRGNIIWCRRQGGGPETNIDVDIQCGPYLAHEWAACCPDIPC